MTIDLYVDLDVVVAKVEPLQGGQVGERVDEDVLDGALAHVEMFEVCQRREITSFNRRTLKRVAVEIQLDGGRRDARRDSPQSAPRAVDDVAGRVTETRPRTRRRRHGLDAAVRERNDERQ